MTRKPRIIPSIENKTGYVPVCWRSFIQDLREQIIKSSVHSPGSMVPARTYCKQWVLEIGPTVWLQFPTPVDLTICTSQTAPNLGHHGRNLRASWGCGKAVCWQWQDSAP